MKRTLTIEESARLIELGVGVKLASKSYWDYDKDDNVYKVPIFGLEDILSILPKEMNFNGVRVSLQMYQHLAGYWITSYVAYNGNELIHQNPLCTEKELIDALNQLAIYVLENFPNENHKN